MQNIFGPNPPSDPALLHYRESIHFSLQETLDLLYSVTKGAYEESSQDLTWESQGEDFINQNWPKDIRLNWTFEKFSAWLSVEPWLKELAEYEWARFLVSSSRDPEAEDWINPSLVLTMF